MLEDLRKCIQESPPTINPTPARANPKHVPQDFRIYTGSHTEVHRLTGGDGDQPAKVVVGKFGDKSERGTAKWDYRVWRGGHGQEKRVEDGREVCVGRRGSRIGR